MPKWKIKVSSFKKFFKNGPGLITGASDDDPSGIATYSQAGAQFGLTTLWTALITFPLIFCIQDLNPIKALIYAAILNCLVSPPLLFIILLIGNNTKIMGKKTNGKLSNFLGIITFLLMSLSSICLIYFWFVGE